MQKKQIKPVKKLRLRKEALKTLSTEQLVQVNAGVINQDPWDPSFLIC
jgi:hypothetical protein